MYEKRNNKIDVLIRLQNGLVLRLLGSNAHGFIESVLRIGPFLLQSLCIVLLVILALSYVVNIVRQLIS